MRWALLDRVPADDVQRLLSIARRRKFERGEVVFHEQDPADTLHLIEKGRFAVRVSTPLGDRAILAVLGAGEMFGELALLGDEEDARRSATVVALEPARPEARVRSAARPAALVWGMPTSSPIVAGTPGHVPGSGSTTSMPPTSRPYLPGAVAPVSQTSMANQRVVCWVGTFMW